MPLSLSMQDPLLVFSHVPNHLSYVCLAFVIPGFSRYGFTPSLTTQLEGLGGRTNWTDERTNERTTPTKSDFDPARLAWLGMD
jgi:hypothetical protein